MQRPLCTLLLIGISLLGPIAPGLAQDATPDRLDQWHQFRGPLASGTAPRATPPVTWSEDENIKWKVELPGPGSSTPIIWEDRVFILVSRPTDEEGPNPSDEESPANNPFGITFETHVHEFLVLCYHRETGELLWQQTATRRVPFQGHHPDNNFASATPTTDGQRLYVPFGSQGYYCYDLSGNLLWQRDLGPVVTRLSFGEGTSLTVHEDRLIVVRDNEGQSVIEVLSTADGKTLWRQERDEPSAWATPVVTTVNNRDLIVTNATNRVRVYDLETGNVVLECGGQVTNVTPSPIVQDGVAYCASGYRGSILQAIPLSATGDITDSDQLLWTVNRGTPYIPSLLLYDNQLYFNQSLEAILTSVNIETGEEVISRTRMPLLRRIYASPVAADGKIYWFGRDGGGLVLQAGPEFKVLAENQLDDNIDASPALVGNQLFVRGLKHLYCIQAAQ